jgi:hypothetical protein
MRQPSKAAVLRHRQDKRHGRGSVDLIEYQPDQVICTRSLGKPTYFISERNQGRLKQRANFEDPALREE